MHTHDYDQLTPQANGYICTVAQCEITSLASMRPCAVCPLSLPPTGGGTPCAKYETVQDLICAYHQYP